MTQLELFFWAVENGVIHPPAPPPPEDPGPRPGDRRSAYAIGFEPMEDGDSARVSFLFDDRSEIKVLMRSPGDWFALAEGDRCNLIYRSVGLDRRGLEQFDWGFDSVDGPEVD